MNEASAREVLLIHAFETIEPRSASWSEGDENWASRQAILSNSKNRSLDSYIARRAKIALQRLANSEPVITEHFATGWWHWSWILWSLLLCVILGILADNIGSGKIINLLAPPTLLVVLWNIVVYILLLLHGITSKYKENPKPSLTIRFVQRFFRIGNSLTGIRSTNEPTRMQIIENYTKRWIGCSASLTTVRTKMLIHSAAAAIGLGLIAGLYFRGLVFDYRAAWESTFLSAHAVHAIISFFLAPAVALSGIPMPDEAAFSAMRMVRGDDSTGTSAASWIHLYSLTLLFIVVIPRLILMFGCGLRSFFLSRNMKVQLDEKYLRRLSDQHNGDVPPSSVVISLVAHSNADKMAFLSSMLGHQLALQCEYQLVNEFQCIHPLIDMKEEQLQLWNIPDVTESSRLVKRLRCAGKPLGWILSDVWDRWRDSQFLRTQHEVLKVKDDTDVILYLINSADKPDITTFVQHEMDLLSWIGKPVIVLIHQINTSRERNIKFAEIESWGVHLAKYTHVKCVLSIDELTQCWMQEDRLYRQVEDLLVGEKNLLMKRLRSARMREQIEILDSAAHLIAGCISRLATHFEPIPESGKVKSVLKQMGIGKDDAVLTDAAQKELSNNLEFEVCANTNNLLKVYGFATVNISEILMPDTSRTDKHHHVDENATTKWGAILTSALTGLTADILSGGLTLGGGLIVGALGGALGGKGLSHLANVVRRTDRSGVQWNNVALDQVLENAIFRYLVIVHRDRGDDCLRKDISISNWPEVIKHSLHPYQDDIRKIWKLRDTSGEGASKAKNQIIELLQPIVKQTLCETLNTMYPDDTQIQFKLSPTK